MIITQIKAFLADHIRAVDAVVVPTGLTAPWWVQYTTTWFGWIAALAAAVLAVGRLVMWLRDIRNGRKG